MLLHGLRCALPLRLTHPSPLASMRGVAQSIARSRTLLHPASSPRARGTSAATLSLRRLHLCMRLSSDSSRAPLPCVRRHVAP